MKEIPVAHVITAWMKTNTSQEYSIVGDKLLWFGTIMNYSLINTNQVRVFKIPIQDNPFDAAVFGIEADEAFIPFTSKRTVIRFESRVPTAW